MENETIEIIKKLSEREETALGLKSTTPLIFDGVRQYLNVYHVFLSYFQKIPSRISILHSTADKIIKRIETEFESEILEKHYVRFSIPEKYKYKYTNVVYILADQIIIEIEFTGEIKIFFSSSSEEKAKYYEKCFFERSKSKKQQNINLLSSGHYGHELLPIVVKKPKLNLSLNYNDDLEPVHSLLIDTMSQKDQSGLVLLHGEPGTGKSTYIRYLINLLKKQIIFLPPSIAGELDSPSMTRILTENPNSIFIIEDAEQLIKSRETTVNSNISMLLNLTDGILGECLGTIVICTFNTDLKNIDEALLRKGRLIASYKFEGLSLQKSQLLKEHLGLSDLELNETMRLSDFYHTKENQFGMSTTKRTEIGF